jgi:hypothetical protein
MAESAVNDQQTVANDLWGVLAEMDSLLDISEWSIAEKAQQGQMVFPS